MVGRPRFSGAAFLKKDTRKEIICGSAYANHACQCVLHGATRSGNKEIIKKENEHYHKTIRSRRWPHD